MDLDTGLILAAAAFSLAGGDLMICSHYRAHNAIDILLRWSNTEGGLTGCLPCIKAAH